MALGIDLKPLERGMDALGRMADALEKLAELGQWARDQYEIQRHEERL